MSADEMFVSRSGKREPIVTATYNRLEVKQQWQTQFQSNSKGIMNLVLANPQEFFKQHLIKNEDQKPSFSKRNSAHLVNYELCSFA